MSCALGFFNANEAVRQLESGFDRICQATLDSGFYHQAVNNHFDGVLALFVQTEFFAQFVHLTIDTHPDETIGLELE